MNQTKNLREAMAAVAGVLEMSRDRLGRLQQVSDEDRAARETVRLLAVKYNVANGGRDYMEQCAKVLRAALT